MQRSDQIFQGRRESSLGATPWLPQYPGAGRLRASPQRRCRAFTLVEVLVSTTIVILISLSVVPAMLHMNTNAMAARLTTLASVIALNQVELVATDAPFSPPDGQVPVDLEIGEQTAPVIIYDDPNWDHAVTGQMTTTVEDPGYWQGGMDLHLRKVTVTVTYRFRNKNYSVQMHTIRASDV